MREDREITVIESDSGAGFKWFLIGAAIGAGIGVVKTAPGWKRSTAIPNLLSPNEYNFVAANVALERYNAVAVQTFALERDRVSINATFVNLNR
jgi:hypothetical protein